MEDPPTCGKGLAEHSLLSAKIGELTAGVAAILKVHMNALDLKDADSKREHDAYLELVKEHQMIASQLHTMARRMAGYRDLPMGRHDPRAMSAPQVLDSFQRFVGLEQELLALLQRRLEKDRKMLVEMGAHQDEHAAT